MSPDKSILFSVVIPFYNNRSTITTNLQSIVNLKNKYSEITQIIAIDDCSIDGTPELIQQTFPQVTLLKNNCNLGFGKTCNRGIAEAKNNWIVLLNSDIYINSEIIPHLIQIIQTTPDLFQVSFLSYDEKGKMLEGQKFIKGKTGLFKTRNNFSTNYKEGVLYPTFYACGGHCLLSREKFIQLKGFSPVFEPFYWEDTDLSYRGQQQGWKVLFDPRCKVIHHHINSSIKSSNSQRKIETVQTRNKILFFWKNITSLKLWVYHITGLFVRLLTSWISGDLLFYVALYNSFKKLDAVLSEKSFESKNHINSDIYIFKQS